MGDKLSLHVIRANCGDLLEIQKQLQLQIDVSSFADYYRGVRVEEREKSEGHIELVFSSEDEQEMMRFLRGLATQVSLAYSHD